MKTVFKSENHCILPAWDKVTLYWDTNIVPEPHYVEDDTGVSFNATTGSINIHSAGTMVVRPNFLKKLKYKHTYAML